MYRICTLTGHCRLEGSHVLGHMQEALDASVSVLRTLATQRITLRELMRAQRTLLTRHESDTKVRQVTHLSCRQVVCPILSRRGITALVFNSIWHVQQEQPCVLHVVNDIQSCSGLMRRTTCSGWGY